MEDGSACGSRTQRSCQSPHFLILSSVKTCCVSKASRLRFSRPTYRASMEPAILAIHDFAPTVVGPTEPDRAATASAHDDTRSQDHPQLHQQAQNVLPKQCPLSCQLGEVALEQWAPWGRPPFGALMQLCFCMARGLPVAIAYLLSNRAEKPVCAPGPCCTLEFAVPSRPDGQQPK